MCADTANTSFQRVMTLSFVLISLSLFSGFFSLGAAVFLFIQRRTAILRVVVLFLLSLILISLGFWAESPAALEVPAGGRTAADSAVGIVSTVFSLAGLVLNVAIVPYLVAALVSRSVGRRLRAVLWVWDAILLGAGLLYPFVPDPEPLVTIMNIQLVVTIFVSLLAMLLSLGSMPRNDLRRSVVVFLVISGAFLALLVVDILISRVGISSLAFLDNTSLPVYLLALNIGSFLFAGRFLNADPLLDGGRVTEACRRNYSLTSRESEIIERLLDGKTNQELADALFISRKTVENHLYNIYQKMDVKNRVQMIGTLRNWNRVEWE